MNNLLYILGNGFDLAHGMETSCSNFKVFCEKRPHLYRELQNFYGEILNRKGIDWWYQFEQNLGILDFSHIMQSERAVLAPINLYDFLTNHIIIPFAEWLNQVPIANERRFLLSPAARYFTFNYTDVLERLYCIPDTAIYHVHGKLQNPEDFDNLVVGHDLSDAAIWTDFLHRYSNHSGMNMDLVNMLCVNAAKGGKKVERRILNNESYYYSLSAISEIKCIGFSFNSFDMPYLKKIFESNKKQEDLRWKVFFYKANECEFFQSQLESIGVDKRSISFSDINSILIDRS